MTIRLNIDKSVFNDVYYPHLFDYSHKTEVYYGGAGSGKSVFVGQKLVVKALKSKRKVLVIRKFGTTLKDSVFQLLTDILKQWNIYKYCKINLSTYTIQLPNGSMFLCRGLDDSEKIKSIVDITDAWIEEATELNPEDYEQITLRVRSRVPDTQIILSFNPVSKVNYCYRYFFENGAPDNTMVLKTTYKDNRFLTEDYVKTLEEKQKTNPTYYRIYALGEFCTLDKLVFNNWHVEDFNHEDIKGELCIGLDFGFVNDTSAIVSSIVTDKVIYVFKEWGDTGKTNQELAEIIKSLGFAKSRIIADAAEQKSIEEIKRAGVSRIRACKKGPDSIIHGIQQLQNYEIAVHPSCMGIKTELENYAWKKDKSTGLYTNKPIDEFNHYIDALRYSLQCLKSGVSFMPSF